MPPATVGDVIAALDAAYPRELAESWDAVGLVCGDPAEPVERALVCVDVVDDTVAEALELGAQLIVAHHPLLLRGVHGVPADSTKGSVVHRLIRSGVALFCAHTNADVANPGVSDALAAAIGLTVERPLAPRADDPETGIGRIGALPEPEPFAAFVSRVGAALPATVPGVSGAGNPERLIRTVAVSGGAGDSYLSAAATAGVDAYVTADLRHHPASEHLEAGDVPALVGVTHWASEWPWCEQAAVVVGAVNGGTVDVHVSHRCTDPWNVPASTEEGSPQ
ncbi:MAG: Nif3-like dinuclear metal center hexameric protein [Actinophytocola sp.]|nr:Nif3-like dinuclear metal center hexameric protein [Actinophytocola sp.]